ncbi:MAG: hypothetical protein QNK05_00500 [Myxococcota bacterium]|nr:hypothetical protein [Myxococcota bacterium]
MPPAVVAASGDALDEALDLLLPLEPELAYANFAPVAARDGAAQALHRGWFRSRPGTIGAGTWLALESREPTGCIQLVHRGFESEHFGRPMARIEQPVAVADGDRRAAALRALIPEALAAAREAGYEHVAARASTRDRVTPWVLQELGGIHVDTQVSWMAELVGGTPPEAPEGLRIEVHDAESVRSIPREDLAELLSFCESAFDRGPLVFDHGLPEKRALEVYRAWTERTFDGRWADAVLVAREGEQVVAFISMNRLPEVSAAAGREVFGRGLGATLPRFRGLFTAIQRQMIARRPLGAEFMENETQAATLGSINVYARMGFRYLRSTSTFHFPLDIRGALPCA